MSPDAVRASRATSLLLLLAASCGAGEADAEIAAPPADTALVACGRSISMDRVREVADELGAVNPAWTRRALEREALVAHLLPQAAAAAALPEASARARASVVEDLARLSSGDASPVVHPFAGVPHELGFEPWRRARKASPGEWLGPFEGRGSWFAIRLVRHEPGESATQDRFELLLLERSFLEPGRNVESYLSQCALADVAPEIDELLPLSIRSLMPRADGNR